MKSARDFWRCIIYRPPIREPTVAHSRAVCPVCGSILEISLRKTKATGKDFINIVCLIDPKHYRAFINDQDFVRKTVEELEALS